MDRGMPSNAVTPVRREISRRFEAIADAILYRWSVERDTWVSPSEVQEARAYLERQGIATTALPDGRFTLGANDDSIDADRLVLLGLRRLRGPRRRYD